MNIFKDIPTRLFTVDHSNSQVNHLSFSPDGKSLAVGHDNGTMALWSINFDELLKHGCNWMTPYLRRLDSIHADSYAKSKNIDCSRG